MWISVTSSGVPQVRQLSFQAQKTLCLCLLVGEYLTPPLETLNAGINEAKAWRHGSAMPFLDPRLTGNVFQRCYNNARIRSRLNSAQVRCLGLTCGNEAPHVAIRAASRQVYDVRPPLSCSCWTCSRCQSRLPLTEVSVFHAFSRCLKVFFPVCSMSTASSRLFRVVRIL